MQSSSGGRVGDYAVRALAYFLAIILYFAFLVIPHTLFSLYVRSLESTVSRIVVGVLPFCFGLLSAGYTKKFENSVVS